MSVAGDALRDRLKAAWGGRDRGYHDLVHLTEVLGRLSELSEAGVRFPPLPVTLAAWFHDAVYDGAADDEEQSARWAEASLPGLVADEVVDEVARLVRLTATHDPAPGDAAGEALTDADLAILASDGARYAAYVEGVRREYAHVSDRDFARGRARLLEALLVREHLFCTAHARARWEGAARDNIATELARLHGEEATP